MCEKYLTLPSGSSKALRSQEKHSTGSARFNRIYSLITSAPPVFPSSIPPQQEVSMEMVLV